MPRFPPRFAPVPRAFTLALLGLSACASSRDSSSTGAPESTRPLRVHFVDWRSDQKLTLVDQSHTDRAKLYSSTRPLDEAGTKVTTDEVLEETLKLFQEQGYFDHAVDGPALGGNGAVQSLEVEMPERTVHMDVSRGTPPDVQKIFRTCRDNFVALYNSVYQLQSVDRAPDWETQQQQLQLKPPDKNRDGGN